MSKPVFQPVARSVRLHLHIVREIENGLLSGRLQPGNRLPTEREMVDQFGASRGTVRQALRVLENEGLIRSRHGDKLGPELLPVSTQALSRQLARLIQFGQMSVAELVSSRMIVESGAARLAAVLRSPDALTEIRSALQAMHSTAESDEAAYIEADVEFHEAIARASGNRFLTVSDQVVHDSVSTLIREDVAEVADRREYVVRSLGWHSRILDAIAERDGARADLVTRLMLRSFFIDRVPQEDRDLLDALVER